MHWHLSDVYRDSVCKRKTLNKMFQSNDPVTRVVSAAQRVDEGVFSYLSSVTLLSSMPPSWTPDRSAIWWAAGIPFSNRFTTCLPIHSTPLHRAINTKHTSVQTQRHALKGFKYITCKTTWKYDSVIYDILKDAHVG